MRQLTTILFIFAIAALPRLARCQTGIEVIPERNSFLLGEPIRLSITIKSGAPDSAFVPDSLGHFEVLERKPIKINSTNGMATITQELVITSFDSGRWQMPPIAALQSGFSSAAFELEVMTLPTDSIKPYGDITELASMPLPQRWWAKWWVWGLVIFVVGLALWWFYGRRKKSKTGGWGKPGAVPPGLQQQLEKLKADWQNNQISNLQLGEGLAELLRQHMAQKGIFSQSKTGEELIVQSKSLYTNALWQQLAQTMRLVNALRFGKFAATPAEGLTAIETMGMAIAPPSDNPALPLPDPNTNPTAAT